MTPDPARDALDGIAIDLGGTKLAAARIGGGRILQRVVKPTDGGATAEQQVAAMRELALGLGLAPSDRVGIAVTGRVTPDGHWRAVNAETLTRIAGIDLHRLAASAFERPVLVRNDAAAAALAEARLGAGRNSPAMAYLTVSTGVGAGIVMGGRLLVSANGLAGHVGFASSRRSDRLCGSGRTGTVESIAAGRAIAAEAGRRGHPVADARAVFDRWRSGADWAGEIIERSAAAISDLCGDLAAILGVDCVVLGGSIGLAEGYADLVRRHLLKEPDLFRPHLALSELGPDAVLLGTLIDTQAA